MKYLSLLVRDSERTTVIWKYCCELASVSVAVSENEMIITEVRVVPMAGAERVRYYCDCVRVFDLASTFEPMLEQML
jgi:hypothetical protein